ncbi:helix-turn-helix domain-containing protein [Streptomyces sp. NPDC006326]|uniref:helix-turn-helix domain-containing protein n=1 Tax=Streptomyces sp. NPDC006326 TaxID=3156752 RepID=UPI0033B3F614
MPADPAVLSPRPRARPDAPVYGSPCSALRGAVVGYRGFASAPDRSVRRMHMPTGLVSLVIGFGSPLVVYDAVAPSPPALPVSLVAGVRTRTAVTECAGRTAGIVVALTPMAAYSLFDVPMHELADRYAELPGPALPGAAQLVGMLRRLPCHEARFAALDRFLAGRIAAGPQAAPGVALAVRAVRRSAGRRTVAEIAAETRQSRRHLERLFKEQVGVTPKAYAQIVRFRHALRLLDAGVPPAGVAARAGFHDQAHLNRDFKSMTGRTPRRFLDSHTRESRAIDAVR